MPKESKDSWVDMFKLNTVTPEEETEETVVTPEDSTTEVEEEEETEVEIEEEEVVETPEVVDTTKKPKPVEKQDNPEGVFAPFMELITEGVLSYDESKEYENSPEGIKDLLKDNINTGVEAWKNQYPAEALEVLEHIKNGGTLRDLIQIEQEGPDYEKDIDLTDEQHQKYLIEDWLTEQGFEPDEIKTKLEKYEESGLLEDEAKGAHKKLISLSKKKKEELVTRQKQEAEFKKAEFIKRANEFQAKVKETKEIAGFQLKQGEQEKLLDYMTKPVKEGKTQMQLDYSDDTQLKMAYFMMKKFDFKSVEKAATTKATIKLKEVVSRANDPNLKTKGSVVPREEKEDEVSTEIYGLPWQTIKIKK